MQSTTPIFYRTILGGKGVGYDARLLPMVAEVYLRFRDEALKENGEVPARYERMLAAADLLVRALANIGIIALVDEATGFQRDRATDALATILEAFIAKELQPYVRTFPTDFYAQLFRLRGLEFPRDTVKRPQYFGHLTNDIVYRRLAPNVLAELRKVTPRRDDGRLKHAFFRRLTEDIGHPKLREHLASVVTMMKLSGDYNDFILKLDQIHPRYGETGLLALPPPPNDSGTGL
jgi:P63C domain